METIVDYLLFYADKFPHKTVFTFSAIGWSTDRNITYAALAEAVKRQGIQLAEKRLSGKRAVLIYQDVYDFIISFLGCQYAGVVPVPVPYVHGKQQKDRLHNIINHVAPAAILCKETSARHLQQIGIPCIYTDQVDTDLAGLQPVTQEIAFIQYTSGSTGKPKGVVISHKNLLHNQELIRDAFGCDEDAVILSWLPFHHDMGLIGNILHTIYAGCTCVLMPPADFMQQPHHWLDRISRYKVTHSGGPNFSYDLCVEKIPADSLKALDLSHWKVAYNGSEPVKHATMLRFADHFAAAGFKSAAFYPCYGLAEATLLVAATAPQEEVNVIFHHGKQLVSSGRTLPGMDVKIMGVTTKQVCGELEEGEICIAGDSVTSGYWQQDNTDCFYESGGRQYFRTGDLGFISGQQLYIHGRLKEMLIVRGKNIYPNDIEQAIADNSKDIAANGIAVFSLDSDKEQIAVAVEIKRTAIPQLNVTERINAIERLMAGQFGVTPDDIILTSPFSIPRTTSGKLQRTACGNWYRNGGFRIIGTKKQLFGKPGARTVNPSFLQLVLLRPDHDQLVKYLLHHIEVKNGMPALSPDQASLALTDLGINSLQLMELINTVNKELNLSISTAMALENDSVSAFAGLLENMLWLKNVQNSDNEVII
ncbi:AMP-binding protein [Chitinophaga sancti]|uniref:AMP-binding protein n=1 Tax=Chitinophaga sancti TaxID=1004 RepID=UPI002A75CECA|nr:AMP-binding protein [Chitinophaga sancti]WPQ62327.1 AMP-binding protein [Chitinophaga sancti]